MARTKLYGIQRLIYEECNEWLISWSLAVGHEKTCTNSDIKIMRNIDLTPAMLLGHYYVTVISNGMMNRLKIVESEGERVYRAIEHALRRIY